MHTIIVLFEDMDVMDSTISGEISFEELCGIVTPIAESYGMIRVYLFGSRARDESDTNSDYDFCIVAPEELDLFDLGGFLYDLQDALNAKVDVVCEEDMQERPAFMEEVLRDRKIVFEA